MRRIALASALLMSFASGALADKTLTYFSMAASDVTAVSFERNDLAPNGWMIVARGTVRASTGKGYNTQITANASAGQKTTIENFITNNVVPALNTQEGL